ncbi:MAG: glycosyltransferase family 4 protein [Anaerolineae bacterium]|nr:glycosyltransferase family 4 protein [Anaerolineae bacterium]
MSARAHIALNAHLLSGTASYRSAGIHRYLYHTLAFLPDIDPDLAYTLFVGRGEIPASQKWVVRRSRLLNENPMWRIVWEQIVAPLELVRAQPDLVHGMAFAIPLLWRKPCVVTIFDLSFLRYPERLSAGRRLYLSTITRLSARQARRVIAISESGRAEIGALLNISDKKIDVAMPGVMPDFKRLPAKQVAAFRQGHRLPDRFALYVGTIEPRKNLDTLLRAYRQLPVRQDVKLVLAGGKGWQSEQLEALIEELDLAQDVIMAGYIDNCDLPLWYNAAEVFVYPSVYEGFGIPVLEAMACGLPVVVSDSSSLPEITGLHGLLVPPTEVEAWSDALARIVTEPDLRAELSTKGQERAQHFTWQNTAQKTVEAYHKALDD